MKNDVSLQGTSPLNGVCIRDIPGGSLVVVTRHAFGRVGSAAIKRFGHDEIVYLDTGTWDMASSTLRVRPLDDSERIVLTNESFIPF